MTKTRTYLALAAVGLLALGGLATAAAQPGPGGADSPSDDRRGQRDERREQMEERRNETQERRESMREAHDAWQDCKSASRGNASLNESSQRRCMGEKSFFLNATHARREARALHGAIGAIERQIGRLEAREIALEQKIASGNLTANETEKAEAAIAKIDGHQERLAEKLEKLKARLGLLHDRWQSVRDHVADRRQHEDDEEEDEETSSSSSSSSASETSSSSSSSSASETSSSSSSSSASETSSSSSSSSPSS
jgi:hypothetical protein